MHLRLVQGPWDPETLVETYILGKMGAHTQCSYVFGVNVELSEV